MFACINFNHQEKEFSSPTAIFVCRHIDEIKPAIDEITKYVNQGFYAVGYLAYEAASAFENFYVTKSPSQNDKPLMLIGIFEKPNNKIKAVKPYQHKNIALKSNTDIEAYQKTINEIKCQIAEGNTYQTNYTIRFDGDFDGDPLAYYHHLKNQHEAQYCAYIEHEGVAYLSISPELFFSIKGDHITTKPMKGTTARGINAKDDDEQLKQLFSEKNQAENMMIVDLLRNDLTKISKTGTINVSQLFTAEKYPTVWQLTSTIKSKLKDNITFFDILRALFPCGSITGAPKASTMKLISQIEQQPRELYCGTIGIISPYFTDATFNIAIRTITIKNKKLTYYAGGGITWDSKSDDEYQEAINKTAIINHQKPALNYLIECLLLDSGKLFLLDAHLNRLLHSATFFNFKIELDEIKNTLNQLQTEYPKGQYKIKLCLFKAGNVNIELTEITSDFNIEKINLAKNPINQHVTLIYHKSDYRSHLQAIKAGCEALNYNHNYEITEFVNGNIAVKMNNKWLTPAVKSGLLAGVMRDDYLAKGKVIEQTITLNQLLNADSIAFMNSVRGWITISDACFSELKKEINSYLNNDFR